MLIFDILAKYFKRKKPTLAEVLAPTSRPEHSELSNPIATLEKEGIKAYRVNPALDSFPTRTKILLEKFPLARDHKAYFLQLVEREYGLGVMEVESWDRYWRKIQQHYPHLRGTLWEVRQQHAKKKAIQYSQPI